jgi:transcriptional regulator with XRE-family HTH domain
MQKSIWTQEQAVLAELLRKAREEAGLTQVQLAELLDEPQPFVSRYESGDRRVDLLELREICTVLGTTLGDFVRRFEEQLHTVQNSKRKG